MSEANKKQVGGTHYQAAYQHWDFAMDYNLCHLAAAATKYLTRYMKKNGKQDVEKAVHYVEKWIEREKDSFGEFAPLGRPSAGGHALSLFLESNEVQDMDARNAIEDLVEANCFASTRPGRVLALKTALVRVTGLLARLEAAG